MLYLPADKYFGVNNFGDKDLTPIYISLPKCPKLNTIDGYDLPIHEQKFRRIEMPKQLDSLVKRVTKTEKERFEKTVNRVVDPIVVHDLIYTELESNVDLYEESINFIQRCWYHRLYGYWFMNNGKPTYIDGWHWFYLNQWSIGEIKGGYPEYRERDRLQFLFFRYLYTTTETFAKLDDDGYAIPEDDGSYKMIDIGFRTFFGAIQPKNRRGGNTNIGLNIVYEIISRVVGSEVVGGIQSLDSQNAQDHFKLKLIPAWRKMWFFFRPDWNGANNPQNELKFVSSKYDSESTGGVIDYANNSLASNYDGRKLYAIILDEEGKTILTNVNDRWNVTMICLSLGNRIHGWAYHPSTVADMKTGGGEPFYKLCKRSDFFKRNKITGRTESGLALIFFPSWYCWEGFVDEYGQSVHDEPTEQQAKFIKSRLGSKAWIKETAADLFKKQDKSDYHKFVEQFPMSLSECFIITGGDIFDMKTVYKRLEELRDRRENIIGRFEWADTNKTNVIFIPDDKGLWHVSETLKENESNKFMVRDMYIPKKMKSEQTRFPMFPDKYTMGIDPVKFNNLTKKDQVFGKRKMSNPAIIIYKERDKLHDTDPDINSWVGNKFIASYIGSQDEFMIFNEEMIKAAHYYGATVFPEINHESAWVHFIDNCYSGYLGHLIDPLTGRKKDKPGVFVDVGTKQEIFNLMKRHIEIHGHRETDIRLLEDISRIHSLEDMTDNDLFAAAGVSLIGSQSRYSSFIVESNTGYVELGGFLKNRSRCNFFKN